MNDTALVRVGERVDDIQEDAEHFTRTEPRAVGERVLERLTLDEGHRVIEEPFGITGRQQWDDVRVLQLRGELDLATESVAVDAGSEVGGEDFDDDLAVERPFRGDKHAAHPAATQFALDLVGGAKGRPQRVEQWIRRRCHEQLTLRARFWCRNRRGDRRQEAGGRGGIEARKILRARRRRRPALNPSLPPASCLLFLYSSLNA